MKTLDNLKSRLRAIGFDEAKFRREIEAHEQLERSAASKKAWADPEVRARMSAARKKAWADPEVRARMSAACKKAWDEKRNELSASQISS